MREIIYADELLLHYVELRARLATPRPPRLCVLTGSVAPLFCEATPGCSGSPHRHGDQWRCSACRHPWRIDAVHGASGIGGRVRGKRLQRGRLQLAGVERPALARMIDLGAVIECVAGELPHAFAVWRLHTLDDRGIAEGRSRALGLPLLEIPKRLVEWTDAKWLPRTQHAFTYDRMKCWLSTARHRALELRARQRAGLELPRG